MEEWRRRSKEKIEKKTAVRDVFLFERLKEEMKDGDEELPPKVRTTTKEGTSKVISLLDKRMKESDSAVFLLLFLFVSSLLLSSLHLRINQVYCQVKGNMTNTSLLNHQDCPPHSVSSSFFAQSLSSSGRVSERGNHSQLIFQLFSHEDDVLLLYSCNKNPHKKSACLSVLFFLSL